jgi:uncharacterized Fe-S center protein
MKKVVYFTDVNKLHDALDNFNFKSFADKKIPVKLHMGEMRNKYFTKADFVKPVIDELKNINANPYLFDTTVAYPGLRHSVRGYKKLAKIHGFSKKKIGCDVEIDDKGVSIKVENREYEVAERLFSSTHIFAISHVKGHVSTGMGGAIKNFGMGGVTKETKRRMHDGCRPAYKEDKCTSCGVCAELCPFNALNVDNNSWKKSNRKCFGCGVYIDNCKENALEYEDSDFQFQLACATKACVQDKNVIYVNDVNRISKSCDCDPFAKKIIAPDIGFLVSDDPVAIDKASLDLINNVKKDVFKNENHMDPLKQIKYGEEIGLGTSSYQLVEI